MGRNAWALIKADKNFNVHIYRRGLTFLILSLLLSGALGGVIAKIYLNEPERDFYATDGITPPIKLTPMLTPNMSSQPLLAPDPVAGTEAKVIPQ
jgi:intracellular multiplication protein IcmM